MSKAALDRLTRLIDGPDVPDEARWDLVETLYPRSFRIGTSIVTSAVTALVIGSIMRDAVLPSIWAVVALAICAWRTVDWRRYRENPQARSAKDWARRFTIRFVPFGIWWGATAVLLFISSDPLVIALAVLAAGAMSAGAAASYSGHPPAALAFVLPAMGMFAVAAIVHGGWLGFSIAFTQIVLIANYLVIIREFYRATSRVLLLRDEKTRLADNLAEAHAALEREGRAKSEFLAHMSHELRTPLNAIVGFSEIIKSGFMGPIGNDKYQEYMGDIHSSAGHLLHIINDVLDLARIEAGAMTMQIDEVDPMEIMQFSTRLIERQAQGKSQTLDIALDPALDGKTIETDAIRLRQVLINLLSNATKFTPIGGTLKLSANCQGDVVIFVVCDSGIGMSPEDLQKALTPFGQAGNPMLAREGTGLGLPLCQKLIERLGGQLNIDSVVGIGTTVTVSVPGLGPAAWRVREEQAALAMR